jgi:hypothetical protein
MATNWKLTGKPNGGGQCEHCPRALVNRYEITCTDGTKMIVGRGCLKKITGWTLSAAQAEREIKMIAIHAKRAANWAAFAAASPELAATILADCERYSATTPREFGAGASHEVKYYIEAGEDANWAAGNYMTRRAAWAWVR